MPVPDPTRVVLVDPRVPENRRFCGKCEYPVGRSRDGNPGLVEGFCPQDGTRFSFVPKLHAQDVVGERYEVIGCLAYGGLGWIYLARDKNLGDADSERVVVLKGLINVGDRDAIEAAVAERRFLVEVDHHSIVRIHDFVSHTDAAGTPAGYIVMEYVGGRSLREILLAHRGPDGRRQPLPLEQVLAYTLEILPALGYLHDRGLVYCDFKPDNVMHVDDRLKLIDLGAVCRQGRDLSVVWGTLGYQAPEVSSDGPTVGSDLYTVGRAMAVLSLDFRGFSTTYIDSLPSPVDAPLLVREESYHRLLRRATHRDPGRRFSSAEEMAAHVLGVLRQVLAGSDGVARPGASTLFTPERRAFGIEAGAIHPPGVHDHGLDASGESCRAVAVAEVIAGFPLPQVDLADPGAGFLATVTAADPADLLRLLETAPMASVEIALRRVHARVVTGAVKAALSELSALERDNPLDWRIIWYRGMAELAGGGFARARSAFDAVFDVLPGELACQLALAVAAELDGDSAAAHRRYARVWRTDRSYLSAAFGLARVLAADAKVAEAVEVLDEVPEHSSCYQAAQVAAVRSRIEFSPDGPSNPADLVDAAARIERLRLDAESRTTLNSRILEAALRWVIAQGGAASSHEGTAEGTGEGTGQLFGQVLGYDLAERPLRFGLERAYRDLARFAADARTRVNLVDQANAVRPRTLI